MIAADEEINNHVKGIVMPIFERSYNVAKLNQQKKKNKNLMEALNMGENDGWTKAVPPEIMKFEKEGDEIEGKLIGFEPSRQFSNSFVLNLEVGGKPKGIFVSGIAIDLITKNNINKGKVIKLVYLGKKRNKADTFDYHDYEIFYK